MYSDSLKTWLKERSCAIAVDLLDANGDFYLKNHVSLFGVKKKVIQMVKTLKSLLFPGIFEKEIVVRNIVLDKSIQKAARLLYEIVLAAFSTECETGPKDSGTCAACRQRAQALTRDFFEALPGIRGVLSTDIEAAYFGDPAARSQTEIMLSYPSMEAVTIYRLAHKLFTMNIPLIPRIMTEYAHQLTGIDIHPGATIGSHFFIDHGTGVVIGETCVIGDHVKLYQGVTLGAKSFQLDDNGNPVKGIKRHPDIEDHVVIYAGATILGGDTVIGHHAVIGGNVWLMESVEPNATIYNKLHN